MKYILDSTGTVEGLSEAIDACLEKHTPQGLLILAANENGFTPETVDPVLTRVGIPLLGGTFPGVLYDRQLLLKGSLVIALEDCPTIQVVHGIHDSSREFEDKLDDDFLGDDDQTMFVFVDGLAMHVDSLLAALFYQYGMEVNYVGGGAGSLQEVSAPCLMTNEGLLRDAAVLGILDTPSSVGIAHGLESVSGPHVVGDIRGNRIGSIDWKPARERFQEVIAEIDPTLDGIEGFPISDEFCLAINRIGGEKVIRDPFQTDPEGGLFVVSELNEGGFVDIVRATPESMIQAASKSLELARDNFPQSKSIGSLFCFDCFTRWQFLGDRYQDEIDALQLGGQTLFGALTLGGEIANCGMDFLDYYNRTCVVTILGDSHAVT